MPSIEAEPSLPSGAVREWTERRDSVVPELRRESRPERRRGKNIVKRAWDSVPGSVKTVGAIVLTGIGLYWLYNHMAQAHANIGKKTNEAARAVSGATRATDPVSGLTARGSTVSKPGTGAINKNPNLDSGSSELEAPLYPK